MVEDEVHALSKSWIRALSVRQKNVDIDLKKVSKESERAYKTFLQQQNVLKTKLMDNQLKREKVLEKARKKSTSRLKALSRSAEDLASIGSKLGSRFSKQEQYKHDKSFSVAAHSGADALEQEHTGLRPRSYSRSEQDLRNLLPDDSATIQSSVSQSWKDDKGFVLPKINLDPPKCKSHQSFTSGSNLTMNSNTHSRFIQRSLSTGVMNSDIGRVGLLSSYTSEKKAPQSQSFDEGKLAPKRQEKMRRISAGEKLTSMTADLNLHDRIEQLRRPIVEPLNVTGETRKISACDRPIILDAFSDPTEMTAQSSGLNKLEQIERNTREPLKVTRKTRKISACHRPINLHQSSDLCESPANSSAPNVEQKGGYKEEVLGVTRRTRKMGTCVRPVNSHAFSNSSELTVDLVAPDRVTHLEGSKGEPLNATRKTRKINACDQPVRVGFCVNNPYTLNSSQPLLEGGKPIAEMEKVFDIRRKTSACCHSTEDSVKSLPFTLSLPNMGPIRSCSAVYGKKRILIGRQASSPELLMVPDDVTKIQ
eukprot:gene10398-19096_t